MHSKLLLTTVLCVSMLHRIETCFSLHQYLCNSLASYGAHMVQSSSHVIQEFSNVYVDISTQCGYKDVYQTTLWRSGFYSKENYGSFNLIIKWNNGLLTSMTTTLYFDLEYIFYIFLLFNWVKSKTITADACFKGE